jgi:uncharacterized damage-inducible protein DinB
MTMEATVEKIFLEFSARKLQQLSTRIETCLGQLNEGQVWARGSENENAIGNLVLHLCGNVRQWIVAGVGGEPDTRERGVEFAARGGTPVAELSGRLRETVDAASAVIAAVTTERLTQRLLVQNYDVPVMEAIYHVVEHFSMHTGQILFATKMLTGSDLGFYAHLNVASTQHGQKTP